MSVLTSQLGRLRTVALGVMTDSAQIVRNTRTDDSEGGSASNWQNVGAAVGCHLIQYVGRKGGDESIMEGRFEAALSYKITLPTGTDVTEKDRILVNGTRTFEVKAVLRPATWEVQRECICVERLTP